MNTQIPLDNRIFGSFYHVFFQWSIPMEAQAISLMEEAIIEELKGRYAQMIQSYYYDKKNTSVFPFLLSVIEHVRDVEMPVEKHETIVHQVKAFLEKHQKSRSLSQVCEEFNEMLTEKKIPFEILSEIYLTGDEGK